MSLAKAKPLCFNVVPQQIPMCDVVDLNDVVSCTSLGGINIRMLGFVIQVIIYILRSDQERLRKMQPKVLW